ncbi:RHS repeat-associated core domain-containing protein [Candidatus Methylomicrobium oryzae]|uniref:RHS repeat-associated core domain-containing protein n=1 Tax=Candidatus Methylomicrobium oryzae TaxID=2802053 RepID=UPI001923DABF|nr:RHS repeat-associated core domain-containing protein [Methylomicrobium sp. RS1]MBL1265044.1 RHS repeat protein [Methylomicrobium sp. RS1]
MLFSRFFISTFLLFLIFTYDVNAGCSLKFNSPANGSQITTPDILVTGSGSASGSPGENWAVQGYINGRQFMSLSGSFDPDNETVGWGGGTRSFSVQLQQGVNTLTLTGHTATCSASDTVKVYYLKDKKDNGKPECPDNGTNPINGSNGNKFQEEVDYSGVGNVPLTFTRYYNSQYVQSAHLGGQWRHSYDRRLTLTDNDAFAFRPDGRTYHFQKTGDNWLSDGDVTDKLAAVTDQTGAVTGWQYRFSKGDSEIYDTEGKLIKTISSDGFTQQFSYDSDGRLVLVHDDLSGRELTFAYDASNHLIQMTDPSGQGYLYAYDNQERLVRVSYPDNTPGDTTDNPLRIYHYEKANFPQALTGITDENGSRYATYQYDDQGRAISSEHAGGADKHQLLYNGDGTTTITDAIGSSRTYTFQSILGVNRTTGQSQPGGAGCSAAASAWTYDANSNLSTETDFNGNKTSYNYDPTRNLELSRTEAVGTALQRTITTTWHPTLAVPTEISEPNRTATFKYDDKGHLIEKSITAGGVSRIWQYTYNESGQVSQATDASMNARTSFEYDNQGNLSKITDALGSITQIQGHDAHGRPLQIKEPSGLVTTLSYDSRGRLINQKADMEETHYSYDKVGQLTKITWPSGAIASFIYNDAHRLTQITDDQGNKIVYTLDAAGNQIQKDVYDKNSNLVRTRSQQFDALSRLAKVIGSQGQTTEIFYDANGNRTQSKYPLQHITTATYDALNHLIGHTDANRNAIQYEYDNNDNLIEVIDPRGITTRYEKDGFGNVTQISSPDTGETKNTYDAVGNRITSTDARGQTTRYSYDALNNLINTVYADGKTVSFSYDIAHRLSKMTDSFGYTQWSYDKRNRVAQKTQKIGKITKKTKYQYDVAGHLIAMTYPSGKKVSYLYQNGRLTQISIKKAWLLTGIQYEPFGPASHWTWGNGQPYQRTFDLDGLLTHYPLGGRSRDLVYDANGQISDYLDSDTSLNQSFTYDPIGQLTQATTATENYDWNYDDNGNRLSSNQGGQLQSYIYANDSNRLQQSVAGDDTTNYSYDASGNTTSNGQYSFTYDSTGRMVAANGASSSAAYVINGLGQRVSKTVDNDARLFAYDESGRLIGEYTGTGKLIQETVYLGDMPVAVLTNKANYFIYPDHLNTPRAIADQTGAIVWRWDSEPFGTALPMEDPDANGVTFSYNLRLPGQYYDRETGLHYNYFRDYDPNTGRYAQSDPIGLNGGINTYAYVSNNPLGYVDPEGKNASLIIGALTCASIGIAYAKCMLDHDIEREERLLNLCQGDSECIKRNKDALKNGTKNDAAICGLEQAIDWIKDTLTDHALDYAKGSLKKK